MKQYLKPYEKTDDEQAIRKADGLRTDVVEEINWMVATGQVASIERLLETARSLNAERGPTRQSLEEDLTEIADGDARPGDDQQTRVRDHIEDLTS